MKRINLYSVIVAVIFTAVPAAAFAAAAEHHHVATFDDIKIYWFNFIVFATFLFFVLKGPFVRGWHARRVAIEEAVTRGERERSAAKEKLASAKRLIDNIQADTTTLAVNMKTETEQEAKQIISEAQARAARIGIQVNETIAAEKRLMEREVRKRVAKLVVETARNVLKSELSIGTDKALREETLNRAKELIQ